MDEHTPECVLHAEGVVLQDAGVASRPSQPDRPPFLLLEDGLECWLVVSLFDFSNELVA